MLVLVDRDDEEGSVRRNFDNRFGRNGTERLPSDNIFRLARFPIALAFDNRTREDNVFEIENRKVVIIKFLHRMN